MDAADSAWMDVVRAKPGHIFADWMFNKTIRCSISRGFSGLCAYVAVPSNHRLAGFDYSKMPLRCHWGLTWSRAHDGWFWYGWDYSHAGDDFTFNYEPKMIALGIGLSERNAIKWTVDMVRPEIEEVAGQLSRINLRRSSLRRTPRSWYGKCDNHEEVLERALAKMRLLMPVSKL